MAKLKPITEEELIAAINEEGLGVGHPFETELDMGTATKEEKQAQIPGTVGVTRTANASGYLCYTVDDEHKMTKCSVHDTRELAYGMALRRYREFAAIENNPKPDGPSFHKGPFSDPNSPLRDRVTERLSQTQSRKQVDDFFLERDPNTLFASYDVRSTFRNTYYAEELKCCIRINKNVIHDENMMTECVTNVLKEQGITARDIDVKFHDNHRISANFMIGRGCSKDWVEINYKADRRPERQNYSMLFDTIETTVRQKQEAMEAQDFADAVANIPSDKGLEQ